MNKVMKMTSTLDEKAQVTGKIQILVVDDHPMLRRGLKELLEDEPDLEWMAEASSGKEAIAIAEKQEPDLILLDVNMQGMDGLQTLKALKATEIFSRVVIFTVSDQLDDVVNALQAGADGYVLKDTDPEDLVNFVRQAAAGTMAINEKLAAALASAIDDRQASEPRVLKHLTHREREILQYVGSGKSNKMIAEMLSIAEGTVKVHVKNLLKKLGMRSRIEAAIWMMENKQK
jgi:two-component system nitrate/nitrite response regulator NarL